MNKKQTKSKAGSWNRGTGGHNAKTTNKTNIHSRHYSNETSQKKNEKKKKKKKKKEQPRGVKREVPRGAASNEITEGGGGGVQLVCGRPTIALSSA